MNYLAVGIIFVCSICMYIFFTYSTFRFNSRLVAGLSAKVKKLGKRVNAEADRLTDVGGSITLLENKNNQRIQRMLHVHLWMLSKHPSKRCPVSTCSGCDGEKTMIGHLECLHLLREYVLTGKNGDVLVSGGTASESLGFTPCTTEEITEVINTPMEEETYQTWFGDLTAREIVEKMNAGEMGHVGEDTRIVINGDEAQAIPRPPSKVKVINKSTIEAPKDTPATEDYWIRVCSRLKDPTKATSSEIATAMNAERRQRGQ